MGQQPEANTRRLKQSSNLEAGTAVSSYIEPAGGARL